MFQQTNKLAFTVTSTNPAANSVVGALTSITVDFSTSISILASG